MNRKQLLLALLVPLIWGCNFPIVKIALADIPPLFFTTLRFVISALVLLPFCPLPRGSLKQIIVLSTVFGFGHFGLFFYGMSLEVEAATASVLLQIGPVLAVIFGSTFYRERIIGLQYLGLALALIGILTLVGVPESKPSLLPVGILFLCSALWAVANILMKQLKNVPSLDIMCWLSVFAAPQIMLLSLIVEGTKFHDAPLTSYLLVLYPAIFSTAVGYGIWNLLLKQLPVSQLAPFALLTPIFGVAVSVIFLGDSFGIWHIAGAILVFSGVFCSTILPARRKQKMLDYIKEQP